MSDEVGTERSGRSGVQIVGGAPSLVAAKHLARQVARTEVPVLVLGETGTGKELIAQYIHEQSRRSGHLVDVDCGAIPDDLLESLLFGHRKGAFTGAVSHTQGLISQASGGTLFLDELGSLTDRGQAKLLRVLETGRIRRVGETRSTPVSFRVVATAQEGLGPKVEAGRFRSDLMQRVAGVVIRLPSLAERMGDVPALVRHFASALRKEVDREAMSKLVRQPWPGNVRQLKWTVSRCAIFASDHKIDRAAVDHAIETGPGKLCGSNAVHSGPEGSVGELRALCVEHRGDASKISAALGVGRSTLYRRLAEAGLALRTFRRAELAG